jgi:hypothetical protein
VHWAYAEPFRAAYPTVPIFPDRVLVIAGERQQLVTSGASMTWHDLVLYLIARYVGATAAQAMARSFALQWHHDGLTPYIVFDGPKNHGDAEIVAAQDWLATNFSVGSPVEEIIRKSGLEGRLRGSGIFPPPVQAHHRAIARPLPAAVQDSGLRQRGRLIAVIARSVATTQSSYLAGLLRFARNDEAGKRARAGSDPAMFLTPAIPRKKSRLARLTSDRLSQNL